MYWISNVSLLLLQDLKSQNKVIQKMYQDIVDKDPLHQLFEQDKELLWRLRCVILVNCWL